MEKEREGSFSRRMQQGAEQRKNKNLDKTIKLQLVFRDGDAADVFKSRPSLHLLSRPHVFSHLIVLPLLVASSLSHSGSDPFLGLSRSRSFPDASADIIVNVIQLLLQPVPEVDEIVDLNLNPSSRLFLSASLI